MIVHKMAQLLLNKMSKRIFQVFLSAVAFRTNICYEGACLLATSSIRTIFVTFAATLCPYHRAILHE